LLVLCQVLALKSLPTSQTLKRPVFVGRERQAGILAAWEGKPARAINEVPLEWCSAPGLILELRHKAAGDFITPDDLRGAPHRIGYALRPLDIVLLRTGADKRLGTPAYFEQPGLGRQGCCGWSIKGAR
jgi:kynurenine formamidase